MFDVRVYPILPMKTLSKLAIVSLVAIIAGLGAPALQAQTPSPAATPASSPAKMKNPPFKGIVTGVDAAAKTFTITGKKGNVRTFTIGAGSTVMNGEAAGSFDDIKVGSYVRGNCTKTAPGKFDVLKVIIGEKEAAPAASASPKQ